MKKKLITLMVIAVMIFNMTCVVLATSDFAQKEFAAEFEAVKLDAAADKNALTLDNSYPIYHYSDVKGGEYDGTFASHLDEYPTWRFNDGKWEYVYYFDTELKKWKLNSGMSSVPNYPDENGEPLPLSLNKLGGIAEQKLGDNIDDFKIVWCEYALCLYGVVDGTEKIVYYSTRPDINKLENGNVYSAEDVMKNAYKGGSAPESVYDESNPVIIDDIVMKPEMYGGGSGGVSDKGEATDVDSALIPDVPKDKPDYTVYIIIGGAAAVAIIAATVTLLLKKKR